MTGNLGHIECRDKSSAGLIVGIIIHIFGSIGINTGQNLQAMALAKLDEQAKKKPWLSRLWCIGCSMFVSFSILNFVALTLAPASILVPLESIQFVNNVFFGQFVRKVRIPPRMWIGVGMMVCGTVMAVLFGATESYCFTAERLEQLWHWDEGWGWWLYIVLTFSLSFFCLWVHARYEKAERDGARLPNHQYVLPVTFAIPSALLGGAQMIVHSKVLSELSELLFSGDSGILINWFFWVEAVTVSVFGIVWFYRLTVCLSKYDPLFIIPLMQV